MGIGGRVQRGEDREHISLLLRIDRWCRQMRRGVRERKITGGKHKEVGRITEADMDKGNFASWEAGYIYQDENLMRGGGIDEGGTYIPFV